MNLDLRVKIRAALIRNTTGRLNLNTEQFLDETLDIITEERKKLKCFSDKCDGKWREENEWNSFEEGR